MKPMNAALAAAVVAAAFPLLSQAQGSLENPSHLGTESGITAVTGWHCTSHNIEIRVDGTSLGMAGSGTSRQDTAATCGRSDTGFSLLFNYALLGAGTHHMEAYADGQLFDSSTFSVGSLGAEFLTGLSATHQVPYFPGAGQKARLIWSQGKQGFVVAGIDAMLGGSLVGTYAIRHVSVVTSGGNLASTLQPGVSVSGTMTFRPDGSYSMTMTLTAPGASMTQPASGTYADHGQYIVQDGGGLAVVERGETLTLHSVVNQGGEWASMVLSMSRSDSSPTATEAKDVGPPMAHAAWQVARMLGR